MQSFEEYYIREKYNSEDMSLYARQNRARKYSAEARKYRKRNRRNYIIAVVLGLILGGLYIVWQCSPAPAENVVVPEPKEHEPVVSATMESIGEFIVVAYCPCERCCGQWALNRPLDEDGNPIVYTASGEEAKAGVTVAVDPDVIPLGTRIYIDGLGVYEAQDTGNFAGSMIDVYFDNHEAACEFGRKDLEVSIITS